MKRTKRALVILCSALGFLVTCNRTQNSPALLVGTYTIQSLVGYGSPWNQWWMVDNCTLSNPGGQQSIVYGMEFWFRVQLLDKNGQPWHKRDTLPKIEIDYTAEYDPTDDLMGTPQPHNGPWNLWEHVPLLHPAYGYFLSTPSDDNGVSLIRVGMGDPNGGTGKVWPQRNLTYVSLKVTLPFEGVGAQPMYLKCQFFDNWPGNQCIMYDQSSLKTGTLQQSYGRVDSSPGFVRWSPYEQQYAPMAMEQAPVHSPAPVTDIPSCPLPAVAKTLSMSSTGNRTMSAQIQSQAIPDNVTLESCTWEELLDNGSSVPATNILPLPVNSDPAGLDNVTGWMDFAYVDHTSVMASRPYQVRMELKGPAGMQDIPSSYPAWLRTLYEGNISKMEVMVYVDEVIHNPSDTTVRCHTQPIVVIDSRSCWTMGYCGEGASQRAVITLYCGDPIGTLDLEPWTPARHPGDANGDNKVDVSDLGILAANYGTTSGATWEKGDFNGDGAVDVSDLGILAANYGFGTGIMNMSMPLHLIRVKPDQTGDYPTIQAAVDAAVDGDVVMLDPGTYTGTGNRDIDFAGKAITVQSTNSDDWSVVAATVIDCQGSQGSETRGFFFYNGETNQSILAGLTVANGYASYGGGVYCESASPTITKCRFIGNTSEDSGGAICCYASTNPVISHCFFINNCANNYGGGVSCELGSKPRIDNCLFSGNLCWGFGGGIYCYAASPTVVSCTFNGNGNLCSWSRGGGIYLGPFSTVTITNCILWGDIAHDGPEIALSSYFSAATVSYSDVQGGQAVVDVPSGSTLTWDMGNIDTDPFFAGSGNLHLTPGSPCINAGNPTGVYNGQTDIDGEPRVGGNRIDIGSDEVP